MLPIRCFSCNKILGCYNETFENYKKQNPEKLVDFFNDMNIKRYCCRKIFLTHIDIYQYPNDFHHENIVCKSISEFPKILRTE
jgi:DNA-directed RNA polymerase subunit N